MNYETVLCDLMKVEKILDLIAVLKQSSAQTASFNSMNLSRFILNIAETLTGDELLYFLHKPVRKKLSTLL